MLGEGSGQHGMLCGFGSSEHGRLLSMSSGAAQRAPHACRRPPPRMGLTGQHRRAWAPARVLPRCPAFPLFCALCAPAQVRLGPHGVEEILPLPELSEFEQQGLEKMKDLLVGAAPAPSNPLYPRNGVACGHASAACRAATPTGRSAPARGRP